MLNAMIARNKQPFQSDYGTKLAPSTRNRQDPTRVLVSYRTFPFGWAFRPKLDVEQRLSALTCPTMVVAGGEDMSASAAAGQLIVNQIANATLHVVADCGHFPPVEASRTFNALLRHHLLAA